MIDDIVLTLGRALRSTLRRRLRSVSIVAMLSMSVGLSTLVFAAVRAIVIDAAAFPQAERLFSVGCSLSPSSVAGACSVYVADAIRSRSDVIDELMFYGYGPTDLALLDGQTRTISTRRVSSGFFSTLRTRPQQGRWFIPTDNEQFGSGAAVLSHALWTFVAEGLTAGGKTTIVLDNRPYAVLGVMPPDFAFPDSRVAAWLLEPVGVDQMGRGQQHDKAVVVRLRDGRTEAELRNQLATIGADVSAEMGRSSRIRIDAQALATSILGQIGNMLWLLLAGTVCLMAVVGANVAVALSQAHREESLRHAIATALGATAARFRVEVATEALIIAPVCIVAALCLASVGATVFRSFGALGTIRGELTAIESAEAIFASAFIVILLGLCAVISLSRPPAKLNELGTARSGTRPSHLFQRIGLTAQLAGATLLLLVAVSALHLFQSVRSIPLGFNPKELLAIALEPIPASKTLHASQYRRLDPVLNILSREPGVIGVTTASVAPLAAAYQVPSIAVKADGEWTATGPTQLQVVGPEYFSVLGTPILLGRTFSPADTDATACAAVVNRSFASALGGSQQTLGRILSANGRSDANAEICRIVGIAEDVRDVNVHLAGDPQVYLSDRQHDDRSRSILVRIDSRVTSFQALRRVLSRDETLVKTTASSDVADFVSGNTSRERLLSYLVTTFALAGCCVALFGVAGAIIAEADKRRREVGIRYALGAPRFVSVALLAHSLRGPLIIGCGLGAAAFAWLSHTSSLWIEDLPVLSWWQGAGSLSGLFATVAATAAPSLWRLRPTELTKLLSH